MREISAERIENTVAELCIKANLYLPSDLESCIKCRAQDEKSEVGRNVSTILSKTSGSQEMKKYRYARTLEWRLYL